MQTEMKELDDETKNEIKNLNLQSTPNGKYHCPLHQQNPKTLPTHALAMIKT